MTPKITTWLLILSVILNISLILIWYTHKSSNGIAPTSENQKAVNFVPFAPVPFSQQITKMSAIKLTQAYDGDPRHWMTQDPNHPNDPTKTVELQGLMFNAAHFRDIVDTNKSGKTPDNVVLFFGLDTNNQWHIIAFGTMNDKNGQTILDYDKNDPTNNSSTNTSVYDQAVPCPPCGVTTP